MNLNLQNLSLRQLVTAILAGFVILAVIHFLITSRFQGSLNDAASEKNAATTMEFLPVQLNMACQLFLKGELRAKETLENITMKIEAALEQSSASTGQSDSLDRLNAQAQMIWTKTKKHIDILLYEPSSIDTIVSDIRETPQDDDPDKFTKETFQKVIKISNPRFIKSANYVESSSEKLSILGNQIKNWQMAAYAQKDRDLTTISLVFLALIFVSAVILLATTYKNVFTPLRNLHQVIDHLSKGDLSRKLEYTFDNEIGKIARSVNKITANLQNATTFVKAIENGKLDAEFMGVDKENLHEQSLEKALLTMREQMKKVEQEEKERKWSTGGLAKFVEILRSGDDDVHTLGDMIISNLVSYTNSNQGGIYILNEEDEDNNYLDLISLYAFNTKKFDKRRYRPGEGLVGQTFLERESIYLLEIPHEYITITSGLGGANPKAILLVPLKINNNIYGVIELASLNEYRDYEIKFVEKLAESIASTIAGAKNNQRTKALLEESQALTEQMQAQEEEMRQNMEELSTTQEEMARKEIEMSAQLTAINNSLACAEFDLDGHLLKANDHYARMVGYNQAEELSDLTFATFSAGDHNLLWQDFRNGLSRSGEFKKIIKSGEEILINATYTPVRNANGQYFKVIELVLSSGSEKSNKSSLDHMNEVEEVLRQNLEELEITQEQLDKKLQQCEITLQALDDVVKMVTADANGTIINFNKAVALQTGFQSDEMTDRNLIDLFEEDILNYHGEKNSEISLTLKSKSRNKRITAEVRQDNGMLHIIWI